MWDADAVKATMIEAIDYLKDVHGPVEVLDWWDEHGHKRRWTVPWDLIPKAQHAAILDTLLDRLDYLTAALENMDTGDVAVAIMQLDRILLRVAKTK